MCANFARCLRSKRTSQNSITLSLNLQRINGGARVKHEGNRLRSKRRILQVFLATVAFQHFGDGGPPNEITSNAKDSAKEVTARKHTLIRL